MIGFSRRQLAQYAVDEMLAKRSTTDLSAHLAASLVASDRQKDIELLLSDIDQVLEERGLLATAHLTSAYALTEKLKTELISQLKKVTNTKQVVVFEEVDKAVIGGIKVETAARSWDRTIRRTLNRIKEIS